MALEAIPAPTQLCRERSQQREPGVDPPTGNLWLFGGYGISTGAGAATDYLNDLWEYNPASGQWAWVSGSNSYGVFAPVEYGTLGVADADNVPGCRSGGFSWTDGDGRLWLFGCNAFDSVRNAGPINDLWSFDPSSGLWTWQAGANTIGGDRCLRDARSRGSGERSRCPSRRHVVDRFRRQSLAFRGRCSAWRA